MFRIDFNRMASAIVLGAVCASCVANSADEDPTVTTDAQATHDAEPADSGRVPTDTRPSADGAVVPRERDATHPPSDVSVAVGLTTGDAVAVDAHSAPDAPEPPLDTDGDGIPDDFDNCLAAANSLQRDADGDGLGDACDAGDSDMDGLSDRDDPCPSVAGTADDTDGDGLGDACDTCPRDPDPAQVDEDTDGIGDACEIPGDDDADGVPDRVDNCPRTSNGNQADADMDGVGDLCDLCPGDRDLEQRDTDADGQGDACDVCPEIAAVADNHIDLDGDGQPVCAGDCDDANPARRLGGEERCDAIDNDCNGSVDDPFPELGTPCTAGAGDCERPGTIACDADGRPSCDAVALPPTPEVCDMLDNDCNGLADEELVGCCEPGAAQVCGSDVGACTSGERICDAERIWGPCDGIAPIVEECNAEDDDCDGVVDEGFNLQQDRRNCGECGHECARDAGCLDGLCRVGALRALVTCADCADVELLRRGPFLVDAIGGVDALDRDLSVYAVVYVQDDATASLAVMPRVRDYVQAGGGVVLTAGTPYFLFGRNMNFDAQAGWVGAGTYSNVRCPNAATLLDGTVVFQCVGERWTLATVGTVDAAEITGRWGGQGQVFSYRYASGPGRVLFWSTRAGQDGVTESHDAALLEAVEWAAGQRP